MQGKLINPNDIQNFEFNEQIKIFGASSDYWCVATFGRVRIQYKNEVVILDLDTRKEGMPNGWQDDAKEAIAKHNNEKMNGDKTPKNASERNKTISRKLIQADDIQIPHKSGVVKIFGGISDYTYCDTFEGKEIYCNANSPIWSSQENYAGWEYDAKNAIIADNNEKISKQG